MKTLTAFFRQLRLSQILTVVLATVVLFVGTACNTGDVRGARPDNPPVQAGGGNNPYKRGGDANTNYNFSPDPKVSGEAAKSNRADLQIISNQLIAASTVNEIQYPATDMQGAPADRQKKLPLITEKDFETAEPGGQIQREQDFGDRVQDRLEKVKESFGEASEFIHEGAEGAVERHESLPKSQTRQSR